MMARLAAEGRTSYEEHEAATLVGKIAGALSHCHSVSCVLSDEFSPCMFGAVLKARTAQRSSGMPRPTAIVPVLVVRWRWWWCRLCCCSSSCFP